MDPIKKGKDIERSSFRKQIMDYEREQEHWDALLERFNAQDLNGYECPHCGKKMMGYMFGPGSYQIKCRKCARFVERRGKPDWAKDLPTTKFFDLK